MSGQTIILDSDMKRQLARDLIAVAPHSAVLNIREATRTLRQNDHLWAILSDIARAKPEGRHWTTTTWKAAVCDGLGHDMQFAEGLEGRGPFPLGYRTSRMSKEELSELIEWAYAYGARHGVEWSK